MVDTLLNLLVFVVCLGVLILVHELGHFIFARIFGVRVKRFSIGFGSPILVLGRDRKGTEYVIAPIPFGGYIEMAGESPATAEGSPDEFMSKPVGQRMAIVFAGPLINYLFGFLLFWLIYSIGAPELVPVIGGTLENSPAQKVGLRKGDRILAVNGKQVDLWDEMRDLIASNPNKVIVLKVKRGEKVFEVSITPEEQEVIDGLGERRVVGIIGIKPDLSAYKEVRFSPPKAFVKAMEKTKMVTIGIVRALKLLLTGNRRVRESVSGPIGIYEITAQAREVGINVLILVLAILSISLAVFNLIPIPMLDGGHLLLFAVEAILGRPLPQRAYDYAMRFGFAIILLITAFVMYNDIRRLMQRKRVLLGAQNVVNDTNETIAEDLP